MKAIRLWDPRFPDRAPLRLLVDDSVASAAVRAGVAAAANPAEAGALAVGGALDPGSATQVLLQHGIDNAVTRVFLPASVAAVGSAAGVIAAIGTPIAQAFSPGIAASALYSDDFETPGLINGRANWSLTNPANNSQWEAANGYLHSNTLFQPVGDGLFGASRGDFIATIGYDTSGVGEATGDPWAARQSAFHLWYVDANNYVALSIDKGNGRLGLSGLKAGASLPFSIFAGVTWLSSGELIIMAVAGKVRVRLDGKWLNDAYTGSYPYDVMDLSGQMSTALPAGKFGVRFDTYRWAIANYLRLDNVGVTIDAVDEFVGRNVAGGTDGDCQVAGRYFGTASSWVYRVLDFATKAVVKDWSALKTPSANAGAWSALATLPVGGPYEIEAGYVDGAGKRFTSISKAALCGIRGMTWGQSNSQNRAQGLGVGDITLSQRAASAPGTGFAGPVSQWASANSIVTPQGAYITAKVMSDLLNIPVGIHADGVGGVAIDTLSPGGANWQVFIDAVNARRGVVEFVVVDQGEGDADGNFSPTGWSNSFLTKMLPGMKTVTGNSALKVFISPVGRFASATAPNGLAAATSDAYREELRKQYLLVMAADPTVQFSDSKLGTVHADEYHYARTLPGYGEISRRAAYSIAKAFNATIADGRGAQAATATRVGAVITLAMNLNGGSGITGPTTLATGTVPTPPLGNATNGIQVSADNFATTLPISSVTRSGNNLIVTLASNPGAAVKIRSHYGWSYDDTSLFYTTYADGRAAIPIDTIKTPLVAA